MSSPVTAANFDIQDFSGDVCERIKKLMEVSSTLKTWFDWAFDDTGKATSEFMATMASQFVPVGTIIWMPLPLDNVPEGYLPADGRAISRTGYANLYAKYGTRFGAGNGVNTFNLPNLKDRVCIGSSDTYAASSTGGEATHVLTTSEIPAHTHSYRKGKTVAEGGLGTAGGGDDNIARAWDDAAATGFNTGGGGAHNNLQPYMAGVFLVKY